MQREEFLFYPVDLIGAYAIGGVKVGSYEQPVGSSEMEERIPQYLVQEYFDDSERPRSICQGFFTRKCLSLLERFGEQLNAGDISPQKRHRHRPNPKIYH